MTTTFENSAPIIVIGMHRSGTRLLAQILERLGVFMGADQQADSESLAFMQINEGILHQCGAFWSEPMSAHFILSQTDSVRTLAADVRATLGARFGEYFGRSDWHANGSFDPSSLFGWKDPRNTFTLPVWREIFPEVRAIHIVRHGVDVAASLARRHAAALRAATGSDVPGALTVVRDHGSGILSSRRGWTAIEALTMWEQYVEKARLEMAEMSSRAIELRFEDLLSAPEKVVPIVAEFCGLAVPEDSEGWFARIRSDRAWAYRGDKVLADFADSASPILERLGYSS